MTVFCGNVVSDGWYYYENAANPSQIARPVSEASDGDGISTIKLANGSFKESVALKYHSGLTLSDRVYKYHRLS